MRIARDRYLEKLVRKKRSGSVKVVTGVRRCGKSYLLFDIFRDHLRAEGAPDDQVVELALDEDENARFRDPSELSAYLSGRILDRSRRYYVDVGLRNARLNLRQQEETHIMENIVYNELLYRGYAVDVGVVEVSEKDAQGKRRRRNCEIDFVANRGAERIYVQSAPSMDDGAKADQELRPLLGVKDFFRKVVVSKTLARPWTDDSGVLHIGIYDFLTDEGAI